MTVVCWQVLPQSQQCFANTTNGLGKHQWVATEGNHTLDLLGPLQRSHFGAVAVFEEEELDAADSSIHLADLTFSHLHIAKSVWGDTRWKHAPHTKHCNV